LPVAFPAITPVSSITIPTAILIAIPTAIKAEERKGLIIYFITLGVPDYGTIKPLNSNYKKINQQGQKIWPNNALKLSFYRSYFHS
jgi:hypothetical protein